jgi:hypothetical protein
MLMRCYWDDAEMLRRGSDWRSCVSPSFQREGDYASSRVDVRPHGDIQLKAESAGAQLWQDKPLLHSKGPIASSLIFPLFSSLPHPHPTPPYCAPTLTPPPQTHSRTHARTHLQSTIPAFHPLSHARAGARAHTETLFFFPQDSHLQKIRARAKIDLNEPKKDI